MTVLVIAKEGSEGLSVEAQVAYAQKIYGMKAGIYVAGVPVSEIPEGAEIAYLEGYDDEYVERMDDVIVFTPKFRHKEWQALLDAESIINMVSGNTDVDFDIIEVLPYNGPSQFYTKEQFEFAIKNELNSERKIGSVKLYTMVSNSDEYANPQIFINNETGKSRKSFDTNHDELDLQVTGAYKEVRENDESIVINLIALSVEPLDSEGVAESTRWLYNNYDIIAPIGGLLKALALVPHTIMPKINEDTLDDLYKLITYELEEGVTFSIPNTQKGIFLRTLDSIGDLAHHAGNDEVVETIESICQEINDLYSRQYDTDMPTSSSFDITLRPRMLRL